MFKKIAIYGAGAIGGWLGAGLAAQGAELSVVARGATLEALSQYGLRLRGQGADGVELETTCAVRASEDPSALGVQDLVIVSVKAPGMADVASRIAPLLGPETVVLTAMNGVPWWFLQGFGGEAQGQTLQSVDPGAVIERAIAPSHVVGCVVHASCSVDAPGVIRHHFGKGLIIGEPAGGESPRVRALAELLKQGGFDCTVSPQIQRDIWFKLWGNMTINPISAFTGATADRIMDDELVRSFVSAVMLEAREIGGKIGIHITQEPEDRHVVTRKLGAFTPSMLQDVRAGKAVEIDALVSAVRELGQITKVPTPFTDALLGLARLHARVHGLYPG
ncbi:2-dehydropantoate 2-reductase [Ottowia thiooxydans]|uniref:2-dehydropantoate 2-reductase n=1 Tax=Ottowia thiooxydans TaxID=219182 RepID=UPI0003F8A986|nr:2-dehydropantoate 2-reductase [Ottowia thiooxydans]